MKVGDLVRMDFEDFTAPVISQLVDEWGTGLILSIEPDTFGAYHNVEVLWAKLGIGWEQSTMLDVVNESR